MTRYEVVRMAGTPGWVMVGDMDRKSVGPAVALFMDDFEEVAQEFADRLNVRVAAGSLVACPLCGRPADDSTGVQGGTSYVHYGEGGAHPLVHVDQVA
jgi:hypothetical protein